MRTLLALALVFALLTPATADDQPARNLVERALRKPPATGLLVTFAFDGGQAWGLGVRPGDVITSYAGKPVATLEQLAAAKKALKPDTTAVPCVLQRGAKQLTIEMKPGPLGVSLTPVTKDKPAPPLPKATLKTLDYARLGATRREVWYRFTLDGKTQVGFEHGVLTRKNGMVTLRHEVGFDGGQRWGKNHQAVDVLARGGSGFVAETTRYENLLNGWVGEGARLEQEDAAPHWKVIWPPADGKPVTRRIALPADLPIFPTYLVSAIIELLPRQKGACIHYRPLNEGMGTVGLASALHVVGEETIEHDGKKVETWRVELRELGGALKTTWWLGASGRPLKIDYGGAQTFLSTKEKVLAGLPEGLRPGGPAKKR
ncbi:MAG: PDZ domain-containing protein [Planctomycetota bacterium]|nr:PDZ domain-containing protein [Planctomycetota bacterium]